MVRQVGGVDENLKKWATERQKEYIDAVNKYGSYRAASRSLNVRMSAIQQGINAAKTKAVLHGYSPEHHFTHTAPDLHVVKGVSTYYDKEGKPRGQWVKTRLDDDKARAAMMAAVEALAEDVVRAVPKPAPKHTMDQLCNLYTFTDCHVGMLAWKPEAGEDWDLKIAERTLTQAFEHMVVASPRAKIAIVNQLGDFLHFDSLAPITPTHGHLLDADGRYSKVIKVATRILRRIIDRALEHHETVHVIMAEGNHDMASSVWLRHLFGLLYENEPRVIVNQSELPYYALQHGNNLIGFHHGHLSKNQHLPSLFAQQFRGMWGETKRAYIHTGHRHHVDEKEYPGAFVIQHPTLAARDAHAARGGWISERQIASITYHSKYGQVARNIVHPEMLEDQG